MRGEHQARMAGKAIARMAVSFNEILTSPKVRARQTAELAVSELATDQRGLLRTHPPLASAFGAAQALDALSALASDDRLLLVGHEPDMSGVLCELTGARVDVKKGGLAMVRMERGRSGQLILLMRPHELALIAGQDDG